MSEIHSREDELRELFDRLDGKEPRGGSERGEVIDEASYSPFDCWDDDGGAASPEKESE